MTYATKACNFAFLCLAFLTLCRREKPSRSYGRVACSRDDCGSVTSFVVDRPKPSLVAQKHSILGCFGPLSWAQSRTKFMSLFSGNGLATHEEGSWQL